ncbi:MAG: CRISPR-associated endonuclease Cas4g/Cas1g [bacterium]
MTLIPISYINTYVYCARRFYYEFVQGEMPVNDHVLEGILKHRSAHESAERQRPEVSQSRRVYVSSQSLKVSGFMDIVEEGKDGIYPVEYKKGRVGKDGGWLNDKIQLCAQALCLEEERGVEIGHGFLYYFASGRRQRVDFDDDLRQKTLGTIKAIFDLLESGEIPPPLNSNKCNGCSLQPLCLPAEVESLKGDEATIVKRVIPSLRDGRVFYATEQYTTLGVTGERLIMKKEDKVMAEIPLIKIDQVIVEGNLFVTNPAIWALLERGIELCFLSPHGKFLGKLVPELSKNSVLRLAQYQRLCDGAYKVRIARSMVWGKLNNLRKVLLRHNRGLKDERLLRATEDIKKTMRDLDGEEDLDVLRGLEGSASARYFDCFDILLRGDFQFDKRVRRPPEDPVNALLSLAYTLLMNDVMSAINIVGLDPYLGFLHEARYGKPSLALDIMEEFRPIFADAVAITLVNKNMVSEEDFYMEGQACFLTDAGRKKFYRVYEAKKKDEITHPVFKYKIPYRRAFELQARILAKCLTGEVERYIPFTVK